MSGLAISQTLISSIVRAYREYKIDCMPLGLSWSEAGEVAGKVLYQANINSFNIRYSVKKEGKFVFDPFSPLLSVPRLIEALACIEYQCSGLENFKATIAYEIIDHLCANLVERLDGYRDAVEENNCL